MSDRPIPKTLPLLSNPSVVKFADTGTSSLIQVARTGEFVSTRYGRFKITKQDLADMIRNFNAIQKPTQLPVDYDHIGMAPQRPGDGRAAGWFTHLELRAEGDELWGRVEWTDDAAKMIRKKEYKFVSPSFAKDHTNKAGQKVGTQLLAAAITNFPFLEGMSALTLYSFSALGDLALNADAPAPAAGAVHLADVGQRLAFASDPELTPELSDTERAQIVLVKSTLGEGDDQCVRVTTVDGSELGWFRANQLAPANAPNKNEPETNPMPNDTTLQATLEQIAAAHNMSLSTQLAEVLKLVTPEAAAAYRAEFAPAAAPAVEAPVVHDLSVAPGESFPSLVARIKASRRLDDRAALLLCSAAFPALAEQYQSGVE